MKVIPLYCPNCGAPVGKDAKFCSQCGSPIVIDDGVKRSEHTVRHIDEARIRESKADELIRLRKLEVELAKERENDQAAENIRGVHHNHNNRFFRLYGTHHLLSYTLRLTS